jgi:hypothetical protein
MVWGFISVFGLLMLTKGVSLYVETSASGISASRQLINKY